MLALGAAIVSGISIYVNKFGVAQIRDPFIYTTVKNSVVVIGLLAAVGLLTSWKELRGLTPTRWLAWIGLGVIGGGIPFLLFFQGLSTASASSAALVQKSLFLWVALLAVPLLGERLGLWQVLGLAVLALGQFLLQPLTHRSARSYGHWRPGDVGLPDHHRTGGNSVHALRHAVALDRGHSGLPHGICVDMVRCAQSGAGDAGDERAHHRCHHHDPALRCA